MSRRPATTAAAGASASRRTRSQKHRSIFTHIVLIVLCLVWIYPFMWMVSTALKSQSEALAGGLSLWPEELNFDNFVRAWTEANFRTYTINTTIVATSVGLIVVAVSSMAGYALGRGTFPGRRIIMGALVATLFLPRGYTILPVFILINALGLNNTLFGIILAESGPAHVVAIMLFSGYFAKLPKELEEAGLVDGAGQVRIYLQIMLPLAKPVAATVFILTFLHAWNSFLIPLVFSLGDPNIRTLGVGMYAFRGEYSVDWSGLAAGSVIAVAPIITIFLLLQRYFVEGIAGAVKN